MTICLWFKNFELLCWRVSLNLVINVITKCQRCNKVFSWFSAHWVTSICQNTISQKQQFFSCIYKPRILLHLIFKMPQKISCNRSLLALEGVPFYVHIVTGLCILNWKLTNISWILEISRPLWNSHFTIFVKWWQKENVKCATLIVSNKKSQSIPLLFLLGKARVYKSEIE